MSTTKNYPAEEGVNNNLFSYFDFCVRTVHIYCLLFICTNECNIYINLL